ncbi:hypothetical protein FRC00_000950 [Tulasnella sp. 408]|nr:hypothetical protein FRC00_000950 [Tulasnella sp. 408]
MTSSITRGYFDPLRLGQRINIKKEGKMVMARRHQRQNPQRVRDATSPTQQLLHVSIMVAPTRMPPDINDRSAFETATELGHASTATPNEDYPTPDSTTTSHSTSSPPQSADLVPTQWLRLGRANQSGRSWNWEDERELPKQRDPATGDGPEPSSWPADLAELEEERNFIKLEGLFSPAPDDYDRQGRRARARGIMTWSIPITETADPELPVRRAVSAVAPHSEKEVPKRRRRNTRLLE